MSKYTKSHSNFVLRNKHKSLSDGSIFERDWVTIGGIDSFAPNQVPIYKSGNFLITINNDSAPRKGNATEKWAENKDRGEIWDYDTVKGVSSNSETNIDKIVIKSDYRSLSDFAYYGSCSELVRGTINGLLQNFPGELYFGDTKNGDCYLIENPFSIDIYTKFVNSEGSVNELKFMAANDWSLNYDIFDNNEILVSSAFSLSVSEGTPTCEGDCALAILDGVKALEYVDLTYRDGDTMYYIDFIDNNTSNVLLTVEIVRYKRQMFYIYRNSNYLGYHVRPKKKFLDKFYDSLDSFEYMLLNPYTEPKYKATFEILSESNKGYTKRTEDFIFPVGDGGYNIGSNKNSFSSYLNRLMNISLFYDEHFSDNLYRMMTHESIKNFDFAYTKPNDNEEEYEEGNKKFGQLIRLFGRELDEIKFYIDGVSNYNNITYSDRNNIPDYFLSDVLEIDGWDIKSICPYKMTNIDTKINFSQDLHTSIQPYNNKLTCRYGYYNVCCGSNSGNNGRCGNYNVVNVGESDRHKETFLDSGCTNDSVTMLRHKVKKYDSEKYYSYKDIDSLFLKRLKLNSRELIRHKGTIEGIEMMLGLFGLRSKRFAQGYVDSRVNGTVECDNMNLSLYDFDIKEYTTFTNGLKDMYWECKDLPRLDWYNKTKTIQYNTRDFKMGIYHDYQGLPVTFREKGGNNILYPYFNQSDEIDGNPYYQMDGGWIKNEPFTFDKDNNIVTGDKLYTETLDTIKIVDTPLDLNMVSIGNINDGEVYRVNNLNGEYLMVDGYLYKVEKDYKSNKYISIKVINHSLTVGKIIFFDDVYVSNPYGSCLYDEGDKVRHYKLPLEENGSTIKIYLKSDNSIYASESATVSYVETMMTYPKGIGSNQTYYIDNGCFTSGMTILSKTHYFKINNSSDKNIFDYDGDNDSGWLHLTNDSEDFKKINALKQEFAGNNPHSGHMHYDGGFKYINYFANLFNYSYNKEYFDHRPYQGEYETELEYIGQVGFKNLITSDLQHTYPLFVDDKVHYFGDWFDIFNEGEHHKYDIESPESWYDFECKKREDGSCDPCDGSSYEIAVETARDNVRYQDSKVTDIKGNIICSDADVDGVTHQIMNTKNVLLTIFLNCDDTEVRENNDEHVTEIKYFQDIVIPYVTQMIPSTTILRVKYVCRGMDDTCNINTNKCRLKIFEE